MNYINKSIVHGELDLSFGLFDIADSMSEAHYFSLFENCFGKRANINLDTFRWFNLSHPNHKNYNFFLKDNKNNRFIAAYGLLPSKVTYKDKTLNVGICTNVMVDPESKYRRKGLFQLIGKMSLDYFGKLFGMDLAFGIPNDAAIKGHLKIGWKQYPDLKFIEKKVSGIEEDISFTFRQVEDIASVLTYDDLKKFKNKYKFYFDKTPREIEWRYNKPNVEYRRVVIENRGKLEGFMVYKFYTDDNLNIRKLHILDFGYSEYKYFDSMLRQITNIALKESCNLINLWYIDAPSKELHILNTNSFIFSESDKNRLIFYGDIDFMDEDFSNFHINIGDNDVY